jgi:hypothetical protein
MTGDGVDIVAQPTDLDQLWYKPSSTRLLRAGFVIFVQKSLFRAKPPGTGRVDSIAAALFQRKPERLRDFYDGASESFTG